MPVTSQWYNDEKNILYIKFDGNWTLEDYYSNAEVANQMIKSVEHSVVTLVDMSTSMTVPAKFLTVGTHADRAHTNAPNNVQIILFGMNRYAEVIGSLLQGLFPSLSRGMKLVGSLDESLDVAHRTLQKNEMP